jgi:5,10-methylenetetrahydromethanopterin reductase
MKFSIRLNNDLELRDYLRLAQLAEDHDFDQFWVSNDLFLRSAPVILSAIAQATRRIQIGSCILNPYTINPGEIAMFASTMDELSGNRFNLGLAAGAADFLHWVGIEQTKPLVTMRETIQLIRAIQNGSAEPFSGKVYQWSSEAYLRFNAPRVTPIYLGAMSEGMLSLAGEMADGVLPLLFPPEHYFAVRQLIGNGMTKRTDIEANPTATNFDFAACIWVSIDKDRNAARRVLAHKIAYYGHALSPLIYARLGVKQADFEPIQHALNHERDENKAIDMVNDNMLAIGVVGDPQDLIARLKPLVLAGANHISFGPPLGPNIDHAIKILGNAVIPALKSISDV